VFYARVEPVGTAGLQLDIGGIERRITVTECIGLRKWVF
jgi:hypothetical protein